MTTLELTETTILSRNPDMVTGTVDQDVMIMSIDSGQYFQLNPIAGAILALMEQPIALRDLTLAIQQRFDVSPEVLAIELTDFIRGLVSRKIILVG